MELLSQTCSPICSEDMFFKAEILKHMAHPVRLCILVKLMREGPCNVGALQDHLELAQPTISQHLSKLKAAGIVAARRCGKEVEYQITGDLTDKIMNVLL